MVFVGVFWAAKPPKTPPHTLHALVLNMSQWFLSPLRIVFFMQSGQATWLTSALMRREISSIAILC